MTAGAAQPGKSTPVDRVLRRLVRQDPQGRWKRVLLAAVALRKLLAGDLRTARSWLRKSFASEHTPIAVKQPEVSSSSTVPPPPHAGEAQYLQSVVKLVQYAFLSWSNSILVIGCRPEGVVKALRDAGYNQVQSLELAEQQAARVLESCDSTYHTVILLDCVEHLAPVERAALLGQLPRLASEFVVASIPTYPEALFPLAEVQAPPPPFLRRETGGTEPSAFTPSGRSANRWKICLVCRRSCTEGTGPRPAHGPIPVQPLPTNRPTKKNRRLSRGLKKRFEAFRRISTANSKHS